MGSMRSSKFNWGQQVSTEVNLGQPRTYGSLKVNQGLLVLMRSTGVNQGQLLSIEGGLFLSNFSEVHSLGDIELVPNLATSH